MAGSTGGTGGTGGTGAATDGTTRRERLVAAALACVEESGPGVGLGQIAERAGIPRPHAYRVIASREELDAEVGRLAAEMFLARVRPAVSGSATMRETVHDSVAAAVAWAAEHPQLYRFLAARQHARAASGPQQGRGRLLDLLVSSSSEYLRRSGGGTATAVPGGVVAGVMGLIDASIIWWLDHHDESQQQVVERLARQVTLIQRDLLAQLGVAADDYSVLGAL